jgi:hypothetical protein
MRYVIAFLLLILVLSNPSSMAVLGQMWAWLGGAGNVLAYVLFWVGIPYLVWLAVGLIKMAYKKLLLTWVFIFSD